MLAIPGSPWGPDTAMELTLRRLNGDCSKMRDLNADAPIETLRARLVAAGGPSLVREAAADFGVSSQWAAQWVG